ncbi:MAG: MucB/RseB C-terminal domain-containing protein [Rhodocyclaceae bacterium]
MRAFAFACCFSVLAGGFSPLAQGQAITIQTEGLQWLQRISQAAKTLSYSGTFVYRSGSRSETSRIVHLASQGRQSEKLEVLDGSPREVIRLDDEVSCYLPENRLVIIEQRSERRNFPALLADGLGNVHDYYLIRMAGNERIAGFDSQRIRLEPRDEWRYGHRLWVDPASGLLLRADIVDAQGAVLESMAFTDLHVGEAVLPEALKSKYEAVAKEGWRIRQARLSDLRDDVPWVFRSEVPGFRKLTALRRVFGNESNEAAMLHWVFSDGLAAFSVFISPLPSPQERGEESFRTMGALSVAKRVLARHQIVVMGDLPPAAIQHFAAGIGVRGK